VNNCREFDADKGMSATGKNLLWFYFVGFLTEFICVLIWWDRVLGGIRISASTAKSVRSENLMAADVYSFGMICHELDWMDSFQRAPLQTMIWSLWVPQLPVFVHPVVNRLMWVCVNAYPHCRPEMGLG
jgi:hypothetical protein